eukprot:gene27067-32705_t
MISQEEVKVTFEDGQNADGSPYEEPHIDVSNRILVVLPSDEHYDLLEDLTKKFCGTVILDLAQIPVEFARRIVYVCGDISKLGEIDLSSADTVFIVGDLSTNYDEASWSVVSVGQVPILVHGVGVYYRRFFDLELDLFSRISAEHVFQSLTESNKPGTAYRTGIYLTPVEQQGNELHFRLLRCSSNLSGPTGNFG